MARGVRSLGFILLAAWLILTGLAGLLTFAVPYWHPAMAILALAAGILILLGR